MITQFTVSLSHAASDVFCYSTMMHMTFYWGMSASILFDFWNPRTWQTYLLTLVILFISAFLHQFLEYYRLNLKSTSVFLNRYKSAALFGLNSSLAYLLMLAVMSFNGGVFIAVMMGFSVGHLLFRCSDVESVNVCC